MADTKISADPSLTTATSDDVFPVVDDPGGTPAHKKITLANLSASIGKIGLAFPATQVPVADANTLDDYEEGSWTPVLTFATPGNLSVTYSTQVGRYTKIGNRVLVQCVIITSAFTYTTSSGQLRVTGLPFTSDSTTANNATTTSVVSGWTKANYTGITAVVLANSAQFFFAATGSAQAFGDLTTTEVPTTSSVIIEATGSYMV